MKRALVFVLLLASCGTGGSVYRDTNTQISSAAAFDPARYAGLWYEIARYPVPFQEGCTATTAQYDVRPDGTLGVLNRCVVDGREKSVEGSAEIVGPGRLSVRFSSVPFINAPYWVLWVDEGYRTAVVGVPSGRAGWILNRDPEIPADRWRAALEVLKFNGYDLSALEPTPQPKR